MKKAKKYTVGNREETRFPLSRIVLIFSAIILLLNIIVVVKRGIDSRETALEAGMVSLEHLTQTISEHVELTFSALDVTLKRALERQYFNALFGNRLVDDMHNHFIEWGKETPQMSVMVMADETGKITVIHRKIGYKTWLQDRESVADEAFFTAHEQSDDPDLLYIGQYDSWIKGSDGFIVLSRRLNKIDGNFGGIVLVAVSRAYISNFFHSIEVSRRHGLAMTNAKGDVLLSSGFDAYSDWELFDNYRQTLSLSTVMKTSLYPDSDTPGAQVYSSLQIPHLALTVTVQGAVDDLLAGWRTEQMSDFIFLAVFVLFVVVISFFVMAVTKQMHRVQRSEQAAVLASQAKSDFLANMSHELRTPLNAIIGFSEMIGQGYFGKLNNRQEERITDINSCGTHLLSLINDILEFSKGEAGKITLSEEEVNLFDVVGEVERMMQDRAGQEGTHLVAKLPKKPITLRADKRKIKQILLNLTSNAMKFTEKDGTVEIACEREGGAVLVTVTDTGAGMKEADIPKALSAFGQVHDDPAKGGTGLGLPLCKMFAELHGGTLTMQSVQGVGTRVTVKLPKERVL